MERTGNCFEIVGHIKSSRRGNRIPSTMNDKISDSASLTLYHGTISTFRVGYWMRRLFAIYTSCQSMRRTYEDTTAKQRRNWFSEISCTLYPRHFETLCFGTPLAPHHDLALRKKQRRFVPYIRRGICIPYVVLICPVCMERTLLVGKKVGVVPGPACTVSKNANTAELT